MYRFTVLLTLFFILFQQNLLQAQTASVSGNVIDKKTNEPLISATVKVGSSGSVTDLDGRYNINIAPGKYWIECSYIGYEIFSQQITLVADQSLRLDIELLPSPTLLETATVTSGKYEKPLGEVTVSLEIIKPALIESTNATNIDQVMNKVPGVTMVGGQANIRGGSGWSYGAGSRVLLLVDDIPALSASSGSANWGDVPVENAEQIEIVKGAASALYGSSALNGIVNFRTGFAKNKPVTKINTFATVYDSPKDASQKWWDSPRHQEGFSILHKRKIGKLDLVVSAFGRRRQQDLVEGAFNRSTRFTLNTRYRFTDKLSAGFNTNYNFGKSRSFFYWANATDGAYKGAEGTSGSSKRNRYYIDPFVTYFDPTGGRHKIMSRYFTIVNDNSDNQSNGSDLIYGEYQYQRSIDNMGLVITTGIVGNRSKITAELYGDTTYISTNMAGYLQLDKKIKKLNLSAGIRYERNKINGPGRIFNGIDTIISQNNNIAEARPVFRLGANYQAAKATYIRTSLGQGYRFPTIAERYTFTSAGAVNVRPSPNLQSETGWSAELGIKQGFKIKDWQGFIDVAAFISEYDDMMEFQLVGLIPPAFQSVNVGDTRIRGIDFNVVGQGNIGAFNTSLLAGYTYVDPKFRNFTPEIANNATVDYNILKYRNKHSAKFDLETKYKKSMLGFAFIYNSNMESIDNVLNIIVPELSDWRAANDSGWLRVDARTSYELTNNFKVSLLAQNLLNQAYMERPGVLMGTRNYTLRLDVKF